MTDDNPLHSTPEELAERTGQPVIRWGDVASLLDGSLPEPPAPEILSRDDGNALFYREQVNSLFGEPESGKTWIALAAAAETLDEGGSAIVIDLDHNGMLSTVSRLVSLGASQDALSSFEKFRYVEPDDRTELYAVVHSLVEMRPDVVVLDSIGELLPALGLNSNSPDDFTVAHSYVLKPLARCGSCVIAIDHVAKNPDSASRGPTGTAAKSRAIGGVSLRVKVKEAFTPGRGGSAYVSIRKDRHGGLRATSPSGEGEPLAATFALHPEGYRAAFSIYAPADGDMMPTAAPAEDVAALQALDPEPISVRDVKDRLGWGSNRASIAYKVFRQQISVEPEKQERSPFPTQGVRNEEHDPSPDEQTVFPVPEPFPRNKEQESTEASVEDPGPPETTPFPVPTPMCEEQGTPEQTPDSADPKPASPIGGQRPEEPETVESNRDLFGNEIKAEAKDIGHREQILDYLSERGPAKRRTIAEDTDSNADATSSTLTRAARKDYVQQDSEGNYSITEAGVEYLAEAMRGIAS